ncbi:unnamed protein product [Rotaria sp. Silwood2]|nr:unnamed protein product [Rotaria sp. Silwood2]
MSCLHFGGTLRWNLTGIRIAGTGVAGDTPAQLRQPRCLYIDANDILYICDYNNNRIQKWIIGASNGTTVTGNSNGNAGSNSFQLDHPTGITFDKYGYMYVADYDNHRVQRYAPNSSNGTTVAGTGSPNVATTNLNQPTAIIVDDELNMFITENGNNRLVFWPFNTTNSTILINGRSGGTASGELSNPYDLILVNTSGNQVYLSDPAKDRVQLWTFGAGVANETFSTAYALKLSTPRQIKIDPYGNLYVADSLRQRVVVFCANSTTGFLVVGRNTNSTPTFDDPSGIAFDSQLNLYVASSNNHEVLKYERV